MALHGFFIEISVNAKTFSFVSRVVLDVALSFIGHSNRGRQNEVHFLQEIS